MQNELHIILIITEPVVKSWTNFCSIYISKQNAAPLGDEFWQEVITH